MRPISPAGARRLPRLVRVVIPLAAVLALTVAATACSDDDPDEADATTTTSEPTTTASTTSTTEATTTTEPPTPEEQVEAAYLEIMDAYYQRLTDPDPEADSIDQNHLGPSRVQATERAGELQDLRQRGRAVDDEMPIPDVESSRVQSATEAIVINCIVDDVVIETIEGEVIDDSVNSFLMESHLRYDDGRWKLHEQVITDEWPDSEGCDRQ